MALRSRRSPGRSGCLRATQRITVFGTVHAPLFHPVFAAKEFVTADHIGQGRFGLNVVCGWNQDEFDMFGVQQREHDERYAYGQEWLDVVKQAWTRRTRSISTANFSTSKRRAPPKPYGGTRPLLMKPAVR